MIFVAPEFLYALGFLAIPIIVHLFNFRRYKTVQFSQVRFLKSIKKQTKSTSRLKHILVLLCRCLAVAALVIAFAQPFIAEEDQVSLGKKGVVVYLDNSFSMQAKGTAGSLLDEAKNSALAIVDAYGETDRFQLHTNDFKGNEKRWLNKEGFINALQNVDYSPFYRSIAQVIPRLNIQSDVYIPQYYLISDLQKTNFEPQAFTDSTTYKLIPIKGVQNENAFIKNASSFNPYHLPGQKEQLNFTVAQSNSANKSYSGSLFLHSKLKTPFSIEVSNDSIDHQLNFRNENFTGAVTGEIQLKDYPISFDDQLFFSYDMQEPIGVLHLYADKANKNIAALFRSDSIIQYKSSSIQQIDFSQLSQSSLVVLDDLKELSSGLSQAFQGYIKNGGSLFIFPSPNMNVASVNAFLKQLGSGYYGALSQDSSDVSSINPASSIFENVFEEVPTSLNLPNVSTHWQIRYPPQSIQEDIFNLRNGNSFLAKYTIGEGKVYLSAVGLNNQQSNFQDHALFVPTLFNTALQSVRKRAICYFLGEQKISVQLNEKSEAPLLLSKDGREIIPKQEIKQNNAILSIDNSIQEAGHYALKREGKLLRYLSFNYNRKESNMEILSHSEIDDFSINTGLQLRILSEQSEFLSERIRNNSIGKALWKYFIILALFFLSLEILLLRILK